MARAAPLPGQTTSKPLPVNYLYTPHHATKWVSLLEIFAPHPPLFRGVYGKHSTHRSVIFCEYGDRPEQPPSEQRHRTLTFDPSTQETP